MSTFPYLNVRATADFVQLTHGRIRQLILSRKLPAIKIGSRAWLVHIDDARELRKQQRAKNRGLTRH